MTPPAGVGCVSDGQEKCRALVDDLVQEKSSGFQCECDQRDGGQPQEENSCTTHFHPGTRWWCASVCRPHWQHVDQHTGCFLKNQRSFNMCSTCALLRSSGGSSIRVWINWLQTGHLINRYPAGWSWASAPASEAPSDWFCTSATKTELSNLLWKHAVGSLPSNSFSCCYTFEVVEKNHIYFICISTKTSWWVRVKRWTAFGASSFTGKSSYFACVSLKLSVLSFIFMFEA